MARVPAKGHGWELPGDGRRDNGYSREGCQAGAAAYVMGSARPLRGRDGRGCTGPLARWAILYVPRTVARLAQASPPRTFRNRQRGTGVIVLGPLIHVTIIAIDFYIWLIIASAIMSLLIGFRVINTSNQVVYMIWEFLTRITEPALRPIRRMLPSFGGFDVSPVILILVLYFCQMVLGNILFSLGGATL